jgi:Integrase core domain
VYLAAVEDLYSRRVVGWSMGTGLESRLVVAALHMAVAGRFPDEGVLAHSDRGRQYASEHSQRVLAAHGIRCSMSRVGNCWDNAPMESFFASLKKGLVHHEDDPTVEAAKASLFEYIEVFYNRIRRHSSLGYVAPEEFESADHPERRARFPWGIPHGVLDGRDAFGLGVELWHAALGAADVLPGRLDVATQDRLGQVGVQKHVVVHVVRPRDVGGEMHLDRR